MKGFNSTAVVRSDTGRRHKKKYMQLPEKLKVVTFGQDCVCIFPDQVENGARSVVRQPHFDEEQRIENEAICAELVRRYNAFPDMLAALKAAHAMLHEMSSIYQRDKEGFFKQQTLKYYGKRN
jgi:hypothetical protein